MAEVEVSEELEVLQRVQKDIEGHASRFRSLKARGKFSELMEDELVSTVLPLLLDLAKAQVAQVEMFEEWASGVEDALEEGVGVGGGPSLTLEEMEVFSWLFARLGEFVKAAKANPDLPPATAQAMLEVEVKLGTANKVMRRLEEEIEDGEEEEELETGKAAGEGKSRR